MTLGRLLVFARSYKQFHEWHRGVRIATIPAEYVHGLRDLRGVSGELYFLKDWWDHDMWEGEQGVELAELVLCHMMEGACVTNRSGSIEQLRTMLKCIAHRKPQARHLAELHTKPPRFASFNPGRKQ